MDDRPVPVRPPGDAGWHAEKGPFGPAPATESRGDPEAEDAGSDAAGGAAAGAVAGTMLGGPVGLVAGAAAGVVAGAAAGAVDESKDAGEAGRGEASSPSRRPENVVPGDPLVQPMSQGTGPDDPLLDPRAAPQDDPYAPGGRG